MLSAVMLMTTINIVYDGSDHKPTGRERYAKETGETEQESFKTNGKRGLAQKE